MSEDHRTWPKQYIGAFFFHFKTVPNKALALHCFAGKVFLSPSVFGNLFNLKTLQ